MTNLSLRTRLRVFFGNPAAHSLAQYAPLGLLAAGIGVTISAVVALPAFAASGLGIVLGGVAVNLTSGLIQQIIDAPDDNARGALVQAGLKQGDQDVTALAAATLAYAGSEIAPALPDTQRDALVNALGDGMRQAGGTLAALAPRYLAALLDPNADWGALRRELVGDIETMRQVMVATNIRNSPMLMEGQGQTMEQRMEASDDIEGSGMSMIGGRNHQRASKQLQPLDVAVRDPEHLRALLAVRQHNLQYLELREARSSGNVPLDLANALRDERAAITALEQRLRTSTV